MNLLKSDHGQATIYTVKWLLVCFITSLFIGSAGAGLIISLKKATVFRDSNMWIIWLLPLGGLFVGLLYHYFGKTSEGGNNLIIREINNPKNRIPFLMGPLVVFGTVITHLFGGSAGREGTAVQLGASIADQFTYLFKFKKRDKKILLICGVSAGFAAVFGTPLAGAIFSLEVYRKGKIQYNAIFPTFLSGILSYIVTNFWLDQIGMTHSHYNITSIPPHIELQHVVLCIAAGICFGLAALVFSKGTHLTAKFYKYFISYPPLRPVIGGIVVSALIILTNNYKFAGLGIPTIKAAFNTPLPTEDFLLKIIFTCLTLGAGYKGGEVTPLFFIGAALGNALAYLFPSEVLSMSLMAGMGFVAVFAGAANTPIACIVMGCELFGVESGLYIAIACIISYIFSGRTGIYGSQMIGTSKLPLFGRDEGKTLGNI